MLPEGWHPCRGPSPICDKCAEPYALQRRWAAQLAEAIPDPKGTELSWCVVATCDVQRTLCGCSDIQRNVWNEATSRGAFEAGTWDHANASPFIYCEDCSRQKAPEVLRRLVDAFYAARGIGQRALRPVPEAPKAPTAEELAERQRKATEDRLIVATARALFPIRADEPVTVTDAARARAVLEAANLWAACRPANHTQETK
jgi:hypothetical protein